MAKEKAGFRGAGPNRQHDTWCEIFGCDSLCPDTAPSAVPYDPKTGRWLKGYSGHKTASRRLREARQYIVAQHGGGTKIIDTLYMMAGISPAPTGEHFQFSAAVKIRALTKIADIFFGKEIRKVISGKVQHDVTVAAPKVAHDMSKLGDAELEALEKFYAEKAAREEREQKQLEAGKRVEARVDDVTDAEFTEVSSGG
jgi:hypothetical protein